jgi:carboxylesterase type B
VNEDLNGNVGLFDMLLCLEWVQRFIGDFGGDPKQVTVMGHGASAMSLGLMATSDLARGGVSFHI